MPYHKYTLELLQPIVDSSVQWAEVCRKLGIKPFTGAQSHLKNRADKLGVRYDHFRGQGWSKGKILDNKRRPIEQYLVKDSTAKSDSLRRRLIKDGFKEARCESCGLREWMGGPIPLELNHKNGDHWDNRLENLEILCPNCHALRPTNGGRNRRAEVAQPAGGTTLRR